MRIAIGGYEHLTSNYVTALSNLGVTPIVTLSISDKELTEYDGLLLPGGGDINPIFFYQSNTASQNIDTALDVMQFTLLHQFIEAKKPILGICKGMQIINVHFGGNIVQHCHYAAFHEYKGNDQIHPITANPQSFLARLYGTSFSVNSAHHQCLGRLGQNLSPIAYSYDNIIEAIIHDSLPIYGLQWHPERMCFSHQRNDTVDGSMVIKYCFQI
ncbi:MAG: gamma-glutamyl-gamma-aminobutyrate hydrolase family protein [Lachnospiraceae bacterium]|nr:gamma-glutamyl-gamma-aminobutyrate hydrolase family protein [Lachnospiraceae bacterium]